MPVNTKAIKRRIKSVGNTRKITKAMEMVSAAKMRRAIQATVATRAYARLARQVLDLLSRVEQADFPLLRVAPVQKILVILVSSNRGLCGSYNANIFKKTRAMLRDPLLLTRHVRGEEAPPGSGTPEIHILGIGKKSADFARRYGYQLHAVFDGLSERPRFEEILPITRLVAEAYEKQIYQQVLVAYTDYRTSLVQEARFIQLLPLNRHDIETLIARLGRNESLDNQNAAENLDVDQYIFEPSLTEILARMLPRLVEIQLYQTILESAASEHSARMLAMRNASDAAEEMIDELRLSFNKARQAAITQEIAEVVGGAAALE